MKKMMSAGNLSWNCENNARGKSKFVSSSVTFTRFFGGLETACASGGPREERFLAHR